MSNMRCKWNANLENEILLRWKDCIIPTQNIIDADGVLEVWVKIVILSPNAFMSFLCRMILDIASRNWLIKIGTMIKEIVHVLRQMA